MHGPINPELEFRIRRAALARARYWANADERLRRINAQRRRTGKPEIASLEEIESSRHGRERNAKGQFV